MSKTAIVIIIVLLVGLVASFGRVVVLKQQRQADVDSLQREIAALRDQVSEAAQRESRRPVLIRTPSAAVAASASEPVAQAVTADAGAATRDLVAQKDQHIARLEGDLARVREQLAAAEAKTAEADRQQRAERRQAFTNQFRLSMEQLKAQDPQRYAEIQEQRQRARDSATEQLAKQSAFILSQDAAKMTEEQQQNHNRLVEIMQQNWTCTEIMRDKPDTEEAAQARGVLRANVSEMSDLLAAERTFALTQLGRSLGKDDKESAALTDQVRQIIDLTSLDSYWRGRGPQSNRGPDQGPGRGRVQTPAAPLQQTKQ